MIRPWHRTAIWSASRTVEMRCEIRIVVEPFRISAKALQDAFFGVGVDAGQRVIEDENSRMPQQGAGNRCALFLPAGKRDAAFSNNGIKA